MFRSYSNRSEYFLRDYGTKAIVIMLFSRLKITCFIIWQGSLGVNPGVLIGSFLVGILPYGPFPWKWS